MSDENLNFDELRKIDSLSDYNSDQAIQIIGSLGDFSYDRNSLEGIKHAISLSEQIKDKPLNDVQEAYFHYTIGNLWSYKHKIENPKGQNKWPWESEEFEKIIINLRKALHLLRENRYKEKYYYCQINTNLGNHLSHLGLIIGAVEYWNECIQVDENFGMALGNLGHGLMQYSRIVYDKGHKAILLKVAYGHLNKALNLNITVEAHKGFKKCINHITSILDGDFLEEESTLDNWDLGETESEKLYRRWVLEKNLFLNPLNDIGSHTIAARDILHLPNIVTDIETNPFHHGLFNVIKQEFISARYLFYESDMTGKNNEIHFSDKDNLLYDTLDYSCHSLSVEKMKVAYKSAYSTFDKIAFFINEYFNLGIPERRVSFRTVWYKNDRLRDEFAQNKNWPLRGLYWLSKDFFENNKEFKECLEPDAQKLNEIRNHLEHKYLKVHLFGGAMTSSYSSDDLAYSISRSELHAKTLRILKLSRAAIMYLSFAVHVEEQFRDKGRDSSTISVPLSLTELIEHLRY